MTRRFLSLLLLGLCGAAALYLAIASLGINRVRAQNAAASSQGNRPLRPREAIDAIESAAPSARSGDPAAVNTLVDAVFGYPHAYPRLPPSLEGPVKQRLPSAEVGFRTGQRGGVNTSDVVSTFNSFADMFGLPDYAKTSAAQLRYLRVRLAGGMPNFMGDTLYPPRATVGSTVSDVMSPVQAVHVALVLADQKLLNPDYQVAPDKWDPRISMWPPPPAPGSGTTPARGFVNRKGTEMGHLLGLPEFGPPTSAAISNLSLADVPGLLDQALSGIGIPNTSPGR